MKINKTEVLEQIQNELAEVTSLFVFQPMGDALYSQVKNQIVGILTNYCGYEINQHIEVKVNGDAEFPNDVNVTFVPLTNEGLDFLERLEEMNHDSDTGE